MTITIGLKRKFPFVNLRPRYLGVLLLALLLTGLGATTYFSYVKFSRYRVLNAPLLPPDLSFYVDNQESEPLVNPPSGPIRNVILMIGDGMGPGITYMAAMAKGNPNQRLHMENLPILGTARTHSESGSVTDSAAAATALSSGFKTNDKMVGMRADGSSLKSIMNEAQDAGWLTGIVATCEVTDGTPASFICHEPSRMNQTAIARDMAEHPPHLLMGWGKHLWIPEGREDGLDLLDVMREKGYAIAGDADEMAAAENSRLVALFDGAGGKTPTLPQMTEKALSLLAENSAPDSGFFLMVEGSHIDKRAHSNDYNGVVEQTLWFDMSVKTALDFARENHDTLVVVTADHDTGGVALRKRHGGVIVEWATTKHTAIPVQVFAYGPGAEAFQGAMDNTDIPKRIAKLTGLPLAANEAARAE